MIREAEQGDAEGIAALLRSLRGDLPRFANEPPEATVQRASEALVASNGPHTALVAENMGEITGFIHTHWQPSFLRSGGEGFISALFIHSEYRGRGLGRALLTRVQEEGNRRGCSRLMLLNMRDRASYERGFYAKLSWKERPEAANFVYDFTGESR